MTAGPATFTARPLARNRPVPMAPPSAIITCCAADSCRASTCSLRTSWWSLREVMWRSGAPPQTGRPSSAFTARQRAFVFVEQRAADLLFDVQRRAQGTELLAEIVELALRRLLASQDVGEPERARIILEHVVVQ